MIRKKIDECTVEEMFMNSSYNTGNQNFLYVLDVIKAMFDSIKDNPQAKGNETQILNQAWKEVKKRVNANVLNTQILIKED